MLEDKKSVSDYFITMQTNENFEFPPQNPQFLCKNKQKNSEKKHSSQKKKQSIKKNSKKQKNSSISSQNSTDSTNCENSQTNQQDLELLTTIKENQQISEKNTKQNRVTYFSKTNKNKGKALNFPNQDSYSNIISINQCDDTHFFAVFDGHGIDGHKVVQYLEQNIENILSVQLEKQQNNIEGILINTFDQLSDNLLKQQNIFDVNTSGAAICSILLSKDEIYCANIGDSRALKGTVNLETKKVLYEILSCDHKPTNFEEQERIEQFGGKVYAQNNDNTQRVWVNQGIQGQNEYGLSLTRTLGDFIAEDFGVIHEPEVEVFKKNICKNESNFIILGTDGLFEYTSNQKICEIIGNNLKNLELASQILINQACQDWSLNCKDQYQDDITFTIIKLD